MDAQFVYNCVFNRKVNIGMVEILHLPSKNLEIGTSCIRPLQINTIIPYIFDMWAMKSQIR